MKKIVTIFSFLFFLSIRLTSQVINEFHYDNTGTDANEKVEIVAPAGTNLSGWSLVFYNGAPASLSSYGTVNLSGTVTATAGCSGTLGVLVFSFAGMQNGNGTQTEPDGIALYNGTSVIEFISYEGSFTAANGVAMGLTSTDVLAIEDGTGATTGSIERNSDNTWTTTSTNTFGSCNTSQLPVTFIGLKAKLDNNTTLLSFSTATEHNNSHFSIERSADGSVFQEIGRVTGKGNSNTKQEYTYTDERPLKGINYYRLRQVDFDGTATYSPVVSVVNGRATGLSVAPSPAVDLLKVRFEEAVAEDGRYEIYDMAGRLVLNGAVSAESVEVNMEVAALVPGIYTLRVVNGRDTMTKQFRKE